jgi:hypothetical protein
MVVRVEGVVSPERGSAILFYAQHGEITKRKRGERTHEIDTQ